MSVLGNLKTALKSVCPEVAMDVYDGDADVYIVYNVAAEQPGGFRDDAPAVNEMYFQVHLFVPLNKNYLNMQKAIKTALFLSGFSYPKVALNVVERDVVLCQDLVQVKMSFSHSNLPAIPKLPVDTIFRNHRVTYNRNDYESVWYYKTFPSIQIPGGMHVCNC